MSGAMSGASSSAPRDATHSRARPGGELSYHHPEGTLCRPEGSGGVLLAPQGRARLDRAMLDLWQAAHGRTLDDLVKNFRPEGLSLSGDEASLQIRAGLACLAEGRFLERGEREGVKGGGETSPPPSPLDRSLLLKRSLLRPHFPSEEEAVPSGAPEVSAILVGYNSLEWLPGCLDSLAAQALPLREIILVDNASSDGTAAWLESHAPQVHSLRLETPATFAQALNLGLEAARGEYLLVLNPDTLLEPEAVARLVETASRDPQCAAAAAKLRFTWAPAFLNGLGNRVGALAWGTDNGLGHLDLGQFDSWQEVPSACFAAALLTRRALEAVGPLDAGFPMYYEDSEWCYRARLLGWRVRVAPRAVVYHAFSSAVPDGEARPRNALKTRRVTYGRLRFATRLLGPSRLLRFLAGYLCEDLALLLSALLKARPEEARALRDGWRDWLGALPSLRRERVALQDRRARSDRELLEVEKPIPLPNIDSGLPLLTWDRVTASYLPLVQAGLTRPLPEFPMPLRTPLPTRQPRPGAWSLGRARRILSSAGALALGTTLARDLRWRISKG